MKTVKSIGQNINYIFVNKVTCGYEDSEKYWAKY